MLVLFLKFMVMLVSVYLVVECRIFLFGRFSSLSLIGMVMCCLIFLGVRFGVFMMILIWIGEMLGKVLIGRFGRRMVLVLIISSMFSMMNSCCVSVNVIRW